MNLWCYSVVDDSCRPSAFVAARESCGHVGSFRNFAGKGGGGKGFSRPTELLVTGC